MHVFTSVIRLRNKEKIVKCLVYVGPKFTLRSLHASQRVLVLKDFFIAHTVKMCVISYQNYFFLVYEICSNYLCTASSPSSSSSTSESFQPLDHPLWIIKNEFLR